MESLRFCARVDLDKLKAKRALVDEESDRLSAQNLYRHRKYYGSLVMVFVYSKPKISYLFKFLDRNSWGF